MTTIHTKYPRVFSLLTAFLAVASWSNAQVLLTPAATVFDKKFLKSGSYDMACYLIRDGQQVEFSTFNFQIHVTDKSLGVYTTVQTNGSKQSLIDTSVSDLQTFKPIYRSSFGQNKDMVVHFGKDITGYHFDKKSKKRTAIKEAGPLAFFDSYTYPYIIGLLPLATGYKTDLAVYDYKPENNTNKKRARIEEVKSNIYVSPVTGEHKVWAVSVWEESTNDRYVYHVDKDTRRLWKVEVKTQGQQVLMVDKETDYYAINAKLDKEQTLKMVTKGNSVIIGEVFARDNQNEGIGRGIAILNINKKQYAKMGTTVVLIPYTDYFKEWMKLNEKSRKKGVSIPLSDEAAACIKVTTVYDNKGNFEFTNLLPGEYLLYTEFGYTHTSIRSEVTGYTDRYINGLYQGSMTHTRSVGINSNAAAVIKKTVTIKADGDKVEIKLKKTL